ncbi:hypothetical protein [Streptomyces mirabilis]|uniref:hypothetical protein n=1 Tax=Streptomyces mirabilis TaxID=68239 RepID=UPI003253BFE7
MVERARRALNELERARAEIRPTPGAVTGIVTVGLLESATDLLAEPLVSALARDRPGIELRLMTAYSGHLQRWLDDGAPSSPANTCWPAGRPRRPRRPLRRHPPGSRARHGRGDLHGALSPRVSRSGCG